MYFHAIKVFLFKVLHVENSFNSLIYSESIARMSVFIPNISTNALYIFIQSVLSR